MQASRPAYCIYRHYVLKVKNTEIIKKKIFNIKGLLGLSTISIAISFIPATSYVISSIYMVALIAVLIYAIADHKKEDYLKGSISLGVLAAIMSVLIFGYGVDGSGTAEIILFVSYTMYAVFKKEDAVCLIFAITCGFGMISYYSGNTKCTALYAIILIIHCLSFIVLLYSFFGRKAGIIIYIVVLTIYAIISGYYKAYRFSYLSMQELLGLNTFMDVANNYSVNLSLLDWKMFIKPALMILAVAFTPNKKIRENKLTTAVISSLILISTLFYLSFAGRNSIANDRNQPAAAIEYLYLSIADELSYQLDLPDLDEQKKLVSAFESDGKISEEPVPHIINIQCESYADIADIYGLKLNEDPLKDFRNIDGPNIRKGLVRCGVFGGGTSRSEYEYLTGIGVGQISQFRNPFVQNADSNTAFTTDPMYDGYEKTFMHPFRKIGWNRPEMYSTFGYDNVHFDDYFEGCEKYRGFVSDNALYEKIEEKIASSNSPQYIMGVTMQGHGDYEDGEGDHIIKVLGDNELKLYYETYLNTIYNSTKDLNKILDYYEEHKEYPVIIVFYGDHFPGKLGDVPEEKKEEAFYTPYLVYSNFCDLKEMPEQMPMCLLFPSAKKAAGLGLTSWEKYLLSLNGSAPSSEMDYARLRNGYF